MNRELNFLLVVPSYASKSVTGSGQRTILIYRALLLIGSVDVLLLGAQSVDVFKPYFPDANALYIVKPNEDKDSRLRQFVGPFGSKLINGVTVAIRGRRLSYQPDSNVVSFLNALQSDHSYDFVVGRYLRPTARSGALQRRKTPVVLDIDDRDEMVYKSRLNLPGLNAVQRLLLQWYYRQTQTIITELLPYCDHVWLTSEADAQEVIHPSKSILPNIPYQPDSSDRAAFKENSASKTVLFVGSYAHRVNAEGVERFILNCWPRINAAIEDANLRIVGSGNWRAVKDKLGQVPNVEIIGFVDDLAEEYRGAAFAVAPLFEGGGTKIKVLETLSYQRTAVITDHAQYGYDQLKHRESLWVAATEQELVEGCIYLLNNPSLRAEMAIKGRETVIQQYSFERFASLIRASIEELAV